MPTRYLLPCESIPSPHPISHSSDFPRVRGYEILSLIGAGGMGVVYKARDRKLRRIVAIKMLHEATLADAESRERFQAEAEAVARLQHPNIIQVFEIGTIQPVPGELHPSPFIALEFIDGGSLCRHTEAPQSPRFAAKMVEKLARAAHAAHCLRVVHRDLKPANVLLTSEGEPKLADFGIAKQIGNQHESENRCLTQAGTTVGTPEYMAPEQVAGEEPTPAVDTYALGVILYQLLTARVPFQGATPADTMYLVRNQEPVSPRRLQPGLPRDLETICLKCLSKSPGRRYESAEALADDLARWLDHRPIHARPVKALERTIRWARREPTVAGLGAAVVIVAIIGVSGVFWKWREAEEQATAAKQAADQYEKIAKAERWERYRADIGAVSNSLQLHNAGAARRALEATPAEYRNWEWNYFSRQLDLAQTSLGGQTDQVHWAAISKGGETVVTAADDNTVIFWDMASKRAIASIRDAADMKRSVLSKTGDLLAYKKYPPEDSVVVLHDIATGQTRMELRGAKYPISAQQFSPDGKKLATSTHEGTFHIWDVSTGKQLLNLRTHQPAGIGSVAFSHDGRILATAGTHDHTACLWDTETGRLVSSFKGMSASVDAVTFNPSGDRLLAVSWYPANKLWLWNTETGEMLAELTGHNNRVTAFAFNASGSRLATSSMDQTIRLWDGRTGKLISVLRGHSGWVNHLAFNPEGTRLVSGSQDSTIRTWDAATGEPRAVLLDHSGEILMVAYSADGKTIVSAARDSTVKLWDSRKVESDNTLRGHTKYIYSVAFHPDGKRVASGAWDGTVRIWNATSGDQLAEMNCGGKIVFSVAFHPNGKLLATASRDSQVRLWDVETGQEVHRWTVQAHGWQDSRLAFSPRGDLLAIGDTDFAVHLLDVVGKKELAVLKGHRDPVRDLVFGRDGTWLASASERGDRTVRIWNIERKETVKILGGHADSIYSLAINPDGTLLASGSTDGTVQLWNTKTWTSFTPMKHGTKVYSLAFTPDGTRLASGCADNTIRLWDVATHQEIAELHGHLSYVHSVAFSPDGSRLVSGSGDYTLRLWDTVPYRKRAE